jgi:hypothetical protein
MTNKNKIVTARHLLHTSAIDEQPNRGIEDHQEAKAVTKIRLKLMFSNLSNMFVVEIEHGRSSLK